LAIIARVSNIGPKLRGSIDMSASVLTDNARCYGKNIDAAGNHANPQGQARLDADPEGHSRQRAEL
jgi:hypothetical protein